MNKRLLPVALALLCSLTWLVGCKKQKAGSGSGSGSAVASGSGSGSAKASAGGASAAGTAKAASGSASAAGTGSAADGDDDGSAAGSAAASSAKAKPVAPDALLARLLKAIKLKGEQRKKLEALANSYKGKPASEANQKAIGEALGKILEENQMVAYQLIVDEMGKATK